MAAIFGLAAIPAIALAISQDGGKGNDTMIGTSSGETLKGLEGDDTIIGLEGNDVLYGGTENDLIVGGAGNDRIYGWAGRNVLIGNEGDDFLQATNSGRETGSGPNFMFAGEGNDHMIGTGCDGCGTGFVFYGGPGNDWIEARDAPRDIYGEDGDDIIDASGDTSYDIAGGAGNDNITVNTDIGALVDGGLGDDVIKTNEGTISGGDGNDMLEIVLNGGTMNGGPGADRFICTQYGEETIEDFNASEGDTMAVPADCDHVN